jgi:WD40 repeat protein
MMKKLLIPVCLLLLCLTAACSAVESPTLPPASPTSSANPTQQASPPPSATPPIIFPTDLAATLCPVPTAANPTRLRPIEDTAPQSERPSRTPGPSPTLTITPSPTLTPTPGYLPPATPLLAVGDDLPADSPAISRDNFSQLTHLARWGFGRLRAVAAAPDGSFLIAASNDGILRYDLQSLDTPLQWMPFSQPVNLVDITLSSDGRYLTMQYWGQVEGDRPYIRRYYFDLANQVFVQDIPGVSWSHPIQEPGYGYSMEAISPDGSWRFQGALTWELVAEYYEQETSLGEMYAAATGQLLYTLNDPVQMVNYRDRAMPEACDLYVFSMCGNALAPAAMSPSQVEFSPAGDTFAVLYQAASLGDSSQFSTLRYYRLSDGHLLGQVGSFSAPVVDFTYLPDGEQLLVGFLDGAVQLVDLASNQVTFSARHFHSYTWYLAYSASGEYLLIQRPYEIEIRRANDGSLFGRYAATASAVSPVEDLLAYGTEDGSLVIMDLDSMQVAQRLSAHTGLIYSVAFSPDGGQIISSGQDCAVRLWDAHTGQYLHPFEQTSVDAIGEGWTESRIFLYHLNFVPGRSQVIGYGSWGTAVSWNTNSGATQYVITSIPSYYRDGMMTIHPQFPEWFGVDLESDLFYINQVSFSLADGALAGEYQPPTNLPTDCLESGPLSADGSLRFTLGYNTRDGQICILDAATLELLSSIAVIPPPANWAFYLDWLYLSPDGSQLIATTSSGVLYVYQITP